MSPPTDERPAEPTPAWVPVRRSWPEKFASAFRGIGWGVQGQSSFQVHLAVAVVVLVMGLLVQLSLERWCIVLLCIGIVLAAELFNSALEWMARAVTGRVDMRIARSLDIASGAVLVAALAASIIGALIFVDELTGFWSGEAAAAALRNR